MSSTPVPLDQCERLNAEAYTECTRFSRFVLLQPKASASSAARDDGPARLPIDFKFRDRRRTAALVAEASARLQNLKMRLPVVDPPKIKNPPKGIDQTVAGLGVVNVRGRLDKARRVEAMKNLYPEVVAQPAVARALTQPIGLRPDLGRLLQPILDGVRDYVRIATEASASAMWAVGLDFRQCWQSQGYLRGRLVRSLPLTPGEQLEVVIRTWDKRTERKNTVESVARQLSTEITGEEKWMLATKMLFGDQANASINPSAGANGDVSIPVDVVTANLGGNLGLAGNFANQLSQSTENSTDYIHSTIVKTAQSLQATRTNTVELVSETGEEATRKQVISNTNRCHTLTYHYFEVLERFSVETKFDKAALHLLIPLPLPDITPEWVLCHECYLRKVLPCEIFYAGLEAAKTLVSWRKLERLYPPAVAAPAPATGSKAGDYTSPFAERVRDVLERWQVLKNAELISLGSTASDDLLSAIAEGGQAIAEGLGKLTQDAGGNIEDGLESAGELVQSGLETAGDALQSVGNALGGLVGVHFMSQPRAFAAGGRTEGGPGTWLYREVAAIASPQIADAMSFLETAWPQTEALPASERGLAEFNVLQTFFAKLGMPAFTFGKVDALFAGAAAAAIGAGALAGGTVGAVAGGVAGAAIAVWAFGVSAIPGAAIGATAGGLAGASVGAAAVSAALAVIAVLEAAGLADTVPDDEGLKDAAVRLKALLDSTTALAPAAGLPGSASGADAAAAAAAATERWHEQMQTLAEAQTEYDRLACHLGRNLVSYMQGLWVQWPDHQILAEARRHGVPAGAVEPRFAGFHGRFGALPVSDLDWVESEGGLDWEKTVETLADKARRQSRREEITLATPGMTVEPSLGKCDACEPFIEEHRALDLEFRRAEVDLQKSRARQEAAEADRFQKRIAKDELDDPTPFEGASVNVEIEKP
jgi:hypothetical protein